MPRLDVSLRAALLTLVMALALPPAAAAQTAAEHDLQAAFLINFARFTKWPPLPDGQPIVVCVAGDSRIAGALRAAVRGQTVEGRALVTQELRSPAGLDGCQVLFVANGSAAALGPSLTAARARPILTVSDHRNFARDTGIIELFVEDGRMRFSINAQSARRAGLQISSRLLGLAKDIHGASSY